LSWRLLCFAWAALAITPRSAPAGSADLNDAAAKLVVDSATVLQHGRVGYSFVDMESGSVLAARDADLDFVPASNMKLYTTSLALVRLGSDYRFRTELRTTGAFQPGQSTLQDLLLIGGGDPNLSGRPLPYQVDGHDEDPLKALRSLADNLFQAGIREIDGDVVGVASRYGPDLFPDGWTIDDSNYDYGAPVSALVLNDNSARLLVRPTANGELADVELRPCCSDLIVLNQVVTDTSKPTHIQFRRPLGSSELILSGTISDSASQWSEGLSVLDPARFAAQALIKVLRDRGISVRGEARSDYVRPAPEGALLARVDSLPLGQLIQIVNKVSQNLHAEMLLREVAYVKTGTGSLDAGRKEREAFLSEAGVTRKGTGFNSSDGSGLSRSDLTTPNSTATLLRYMWTLSARDVWLESLPVGAWDGSLEHRFRGLPGSQRVHAKTGSLSHVNALSGYFQMKSRRNIAFSIMVNGTLAPESVVREFIDRLCALFLD
jgi:D-alanyl-D-alanine carboxypeptidase/D-alanyl-D-alanine-endopeptidase (penicillin-binding protein 4)